VVGFSHEVKCMRKYFVIHTALQMELLMYPLVFALLCLALRISGQRRRLTPTYLESGFMCSGCRVLQVRDTYTNHYLLNDELDQALFPRQVESSSF
jgi:hypothetical protein